MSGSSNGKLIGAGLGGALVMLAIGVAIWPKPPEPAPASPPPPAVEQAAPAVQEQAVVPAEPPVEPVPAPAAATTVEWPAVPEVGHVAPNAPPPLRFPVTDREREIYVADAARDIGDLALQRSLRSARWTFDANIAPVRGRVVVDVNDEVAVLRIAEFDTVATWRQGRCMRRAGLLLSNCEDFEEQILSAVARASRPLLLGAWLDSGAKSEFSAVSYERNTVRVGVAAPGGKPILTCDFREQGKSLQLSMLDAMTMACPSIIFEAHRNVGGLTLPSVWQFAWNVTVDAPQPPPTKPGPDEGTGAPSITSTGRGYDRDFAADESGEKLDAAQVAALAESCTKRRLLLVDVVPITVVVPKLESPQAEAEPRVEKRLAQQLRAVAVSGADMIFPAIGKVFGDSAEIDRRRNVLGLVVGKDGLAVAAPVLPEVKIATPIELGDVAVVRQRLMAKPTLLVAKMQEFAATVGKTHKIAPGPWIAWALHIDDQAPAWATSEVVFEFEIPIVP